MIADVTPTGGEGMQALVQEPRPPGYRTSSSVVQPHAMGLSHSLAEYSLNLQMNGLGTPAGVSNLQDDVSPSNCSTTTALDLPNSDSAASRLNFAHVPARSVNLPVTPKKLAMDEPGDEFDQPIPQPVRRAISDSRGEKLPDALQRMLGSKFDRDLRHVSMHRDGAASDAAHSIGANAFARGNSVFFRNGAYQPDSVNGQALIAHELTHVIQQNGSSGSGSQHARGPEEFARRASEAHLAGYGSLEAGPATPVRVAADSGVVIEDDIGQSSISTSSPDVAANVSWDYQDAANQHRAQVGVTDATAAALDEKAIQTADVARILVKQQSRRKGKQKKKDKAPSGPNSSPDLRDATVQEIEDQRRVFAKAQILSPDAKERARLGRALENTDRAKDTREAAEAAKRKAAAQALTRRIKLLGMRTQDLKHDVGDRNERRKSTWSGITGPTHAYGGAWDEIETTDFSDANLYLKKAAELTSDTSTVSEAQLQYAELQLNLAGGEFVDLDSRFAEYEEGIQRGGGRVVKGLEVAKAAGQAAANELGGPALSFAYNTTQDLAQQAVDVGINGGDIDVTGALWDSAENVVIGEVAGAGGSAVGEGLAPALKGAGKWGGAVIKGTAEFGTSTAISSVITGNDPADALSLETAGSMLISHAAKQHRARMSSVAAAVQNETRSDTPPEGHSSAGGSRTVVDASVNVGEASPTSASPPPQGNLLAIPTVPFEVPVPVVSTPELPAGTAPALPAATPAPAMGIQPPVSRSNADANEIRASASNSNQSKPSETGGALSPAVPTPALIGDRPVGPRPADSPMVPLRVTRPPGEEPARIRRSGASPSYAKNPKTGVPSGRAPKAESKRGATKKRGAAPLPGGSARDPVATDVATQARIDEIAPHNAERAFRMGSDAPTNPDRATTKEEWKKAESRRRWGNAVDALTDAMDQDASTPMEKGGRIGGRKVPDQQIQRLDIDPAPNKNDGSPFDYPVPTRDGETGRDAARRVRQVVGKTISEIPEFAEIWNEVREKIEAKEKLTKENWRSQYKEAALQFWRAIGSRPRVGKVADRRPRADETAANRRPKYDYASAARARLTEAGFTKTLGSPNAPTLEGADPNLREAEYRLSLDHIQPGSKADNWQEALDPRNLRLMFALPNSELFNSEQRHPSLDPDAPLWPEE
jgi:hypothetical protein